MVGRLLNSGGLTAVLLSLSYLSVVVAPNLHSIAVSRFNWPQEAAEVLSNHLYTPLNQDYTEEQADSFLSHGLRQLFDETTKMHATKERRSGKKMLKSLIRFATVFPDHSATVEGMQRQEHSRWVSVPLLEPSPTNPEVMQYHQVLLPGLRLMRSLDVIRLDKFNVKSAEGFWLPTGIVRPYWSDPAISLRLKVVYEFPTSVNKYQSLYQVNPQLAAASLRQALETKQEAWTRKLQPEELLMVTRMWDRAPGSKLLETLPSLPSFREGKGKSIWTPGPSSGSPGSPSAGRGSKLKHELPEVNTDSDRASEDTAREPVTRSHALVEHDFFDPQREVSNHPIRPQPIYPVQHSPRQQQDAPRFGPSYLHSLDKEHNVDLHLSLAPSASGRRELNFKRIHNRPSH